MTRRLAVLAVFVLAAAACSSAEETTTTAPTTTTTAPTTTTSTTTSTTTTTTTIPPIEVADTINGLPGDPGTEDRRVIGVKIDNHPRARPQSGIQEADAVYEIKVEGGLTRFIALFHQSDSTFVGPVRSARPTDSALMNPLGGPLQVSGGQPWVMSIYRSQGTPVIGDTGATTYRMSHRPGPHNLYTSTPAIRDNADERGIPDEPPPALFEFGEPTAPTEFASKITMDWSDHDDVVWRYDPARGYQRFYGTTPHTWVDSDFNEGTITADTLVVIRATPYTARPSSGTPGTAVPATETTGEGEAIVFNSGGVITGRWSRPEITDGFILTAEDGTAIVIEPGRLWISVFPDNRDLVW